MATKASRTLILIIEKQAASFMGPHGYRLACLGASLSVPALHSLHTAEFWARWAHVPEWWFMCM